MANNFQVRDANGALVTLASTDTGGGTQAVIHRIADATNAHYLPTGDAAARTIYVTPNDGTTSVTVKPASTLAQVTDASLVVQPLQATDGTHTAPLGDAVARAVVVKVTDGANPVAVTTASAAVAENTSTWLKALAGLYAIDPAASAGSQQVPVQCQATATPNLRVALYSGPNVASLAQFHNTDNQSLGGSAYGLLAGGVTQIKNAAGNLDRQTETGTDGIPALGITTGAAQFATGFYTTDSADNFAAGTRTFTPAAMAGLAGAAPWSIQAGSVLLLDANTVLVTLGAQSSGNFTLTFNNQTTSNIAFNATAAAVATALQGLSSIGSSSNVSVSGSAGGPYTVVLPAQLAGVLNGVTGNFSGLTTPANAGVTYPNKEVVVVTAVTATGFTAVTAKSHNGTGAIPFGVWGAVYNQEKDVSGETDGSKGVGVNSAVEIQYNGGAVNATSNYDRARNLQGKGFTQQTGLTITQYATSLTLGSNPTNLYPGQQIILGPTAEAVYVDQTYTPGSTTVPLTSPVQNASQTTAAWSSFAPAGPGLNTFLPDGEGIEVAALYDATSGRYALLRSASGDALDAKNVPVETPGLFNGSGSASSSIDRARSGSAANLSGKSSAGSELCASPGEWSAGGTPTPAAATQATVTQAAGGVGVRHVCRSISATLATAGTAQSAAVQLNLRDGATGAGTVLWSKQVVLPSNSVWEVNLTGLNVVGSANTAMTLEFGAAGAAGSYQSVGLTGYDCS